MTEDIQQSVTTDTDVIRWICGVSLKDRIPITNLLLHYGLYSFNDTLRWNRLSSMDT